MKADVRLEDNEVIAEGDLRVTGCVRASRFEATCAPPEVIMHVYHFATRAYIPPSQPLQANEHYQARVTLHNRSTTSVFAYLMVLVRSSDMDLRGGSGLLRWDGPLRPGDTTEEQTLTFDPLISVPAEARGELFQFMIKGALLPVVEGSGSVTQPELPRPILALRTDPITTCVHRAVEVPITLRNEGLLPLIINQFELRGDSAFSLKTPLTAPLTLIASAQTILPVLFDPTRLGSFLTTATVTSNDPAAPVQTIQIRGACKTGQLVAQPQSVEVTYPRATTGPFQWDVATIHIRNDLAFDTTISAVAVSKTMHGPFSLKIDKPPATPFVLRGGEVLVVSLMLLGKPSGVSRPPDANETLTVTYAGGVLTVPIRCAAVIDPA